MLVAIIQANGNTKMNTPVNRTRCNQPRRTMYAASFHSRGCPFGATTTSLSDAVRSRLFIMHPFLAEPQLQQRQQQDDDEQDPRERRSVTHAEELERLLEQVVCVEQRRAGWFAIGRHDVRFGEDLHRSDYSDDQVEQDVWAE